MKILAIDPAGEHGSRGMGTTGFALMEDGEIKWLRDIKAKDFSSEVEYWDEIINLIDEEWPDHIVCEGYRLYHHKGQAASAQANSELQTPQLIGLIKYHAFRLKIPVTIQFASEIKTRWSEKVLVQLGILEKKGNKHYWNGKSTLTHHRDALKHALHWTRYKGGKA